MVCWLKLLKNFSVYSSRFRLFIFLVSLLFAAAPVAVLAVVVYRKLKVFSLIFELVHMGANDR